MILKKKLNLVMVRFIKFLNDILLVGCYHPSPRNVNTGRINENKMTNLFKKVIKLVN